MKIVLGPIQRTKFRRVFRRRKKKVSELGQQADSYVEYMFLRRLGKLLPVKRFVAVWILLFALTSVLVILQVRALSDFYQTLTPVPGGVYTEGMVGTFTNSNPLYANGAADSAVSRLVFSGLFSYDPANKLSPNLAEKFELDSKETKYVVTLKRNIKWHDGQDFNADDVIFTYKTIQNQDAKSSLFSSWQGIKVTKKDDFVVVFELPNPLSSFPHALINGIVPEHLLKDIPVVQLRSANFNISPVGTGPFQWKFVEVKGGDNKSREQRITLAPYNDYHFGKPKLDGFSIRTFRDEPTLTSAFMANEMNAISGLEILPDVLNDDSSLEIQTTPLTSQVMAFMNNSKDNLKDPKVRSALVQAVNKQQIIKAVEYPANIIDEPLLKGQIGYNKAFAQPGFSPVVANQLLDQAGLVKGPDGFRTKNGEPFTLVLHSQNNLEYTSVAQVLQQQWNLVGVKTEVKYNSADDLQSSIIPGHEYDVLLYGVSVGVDPDVFPYWHSSQAGPSTQSRLNLSEYKSATADSSLEAGRIRSDPVQRALKYQPFLSAWKNDSPAVALYQPTYLYISNGKVYGYQRTAMNSGIDRFYNVQNWMIREQKQNL